MESPCKRQRLSRRSVPDADLQKRRARNDNRLKSIFESIFDKYGKNFDGIGDEIDLRTGEIVVNNGHLLGMANETDAGQVKILSENIANGYSSEEEEGNRQDPDEGDAALVSESEIGLQHLYGVDFPMQNAETGPLSTTFGRSLHEQIIDYESEEDELADSAVEWVTPREARAIAFQKWELPGDGPTFTDESLLEEAWRAPPLPKSIPPCSSVRKAMPNTDGVRAPMDPEESGISLWVSTGQKRRRSRLAEPPHLTLPASSVPSSNGPKARDYDSNRSGVNRRNLPWTEEEEDLLRHLKENTTLTYREMNSYFPKRHWESVASKWTRIVNCSKTGQSVNEDIRRKPKATSPSSPYPAWPTLEGDHGNNEKLRYRRQQDSESHISWNHPTDTFASELSSLVQESVDGYLRPHPQNVEASWLSEDYGTSAQTLSRVVPPAITNGHYLLEELQRGFRVRYPPDSHSNEIGRTSQAQPPPLSLNYLDYPSGHTETSVDFQGYRHPSPRHDLQLHDAASPPPSYPRGVENGVTMRRKLRVKQSANYGHVINSKGGPLPRAESEEQVMISEPVLDTVAGVCPELHSPGSYTPDVAISVPAQPTETPLATCADYQQEDLSPIPTTRPTQELTPSLLGPVNPSRATKPDCIPPAVTSGVEHVVQVLIPRPKPYKVCEPPIRPELSLAEETLVLSTPEIAQNQQQIVISVLCEPGRGSSPSEAALADSEAVHDVEIPDSQPEFSSPIVMNNENAESVVTSSRPSSKTSTLARQNSEQPNNQTITKIDGPGPEFDDELSILTLRPKRQLRTAVTAPVVNSRRSKVVTPLTRQARKKREVKATESTINASFSSFPSDLLDCSDDELSFI